MHETIPPTHPEMAVYLQRATAERSAAFLRLITGTRRRIVGMWRAIHGGDDVSATPDMPGGARC